MTPSVERILFVLQTTAVGGMETHVVDLAAEFVTRGATARVVVPEDAEFDSLAARFEAVGAIPLRLDSDARQGRLAQVSRAWAFIRLLRRARPQVVHLHTGGATGGLLPLLLARTFARGSVVLTEHDVPVKKPTRRQRWKRRAVDRICHLVIAVSRRNAGIRRSRLGARRGHFACVLNGVPIPEDDDSGERAAARSSTLQKYDIPPAAIVLGSLVRLAEGKGLRDLLRAFAGLPQSHDARLLLVGDGPLETDLGKLATELGIGSSIVFAGQQRDPVPYLQAMDVFVLPVPAGSQSIALLEAMAQSVPPIITFCGPEEAVIDGRTGLCAPPGDPEGLRAALQRLAGDEALRRTLGAAARDHVAAEFSVGRVADDMQSAYAGARQGKLPARLDAFEPPVAR
jgi:glycosyltransferase involved in cell wall biosynthesis